MPHYKVNVRRKKELSYGQPLNETDWNFFDPIDALTDRATAAMRTEKAFEALFLISANYAFEWTTEYNISGSVYDFQNLLQRAVKESSLWPTLIIDYRMPQGDDAAFIPCSRATNTKQTFCIEEQHIALNGQRVLLYLEDYQDYKAERYPHWLELLTTYYHEIAHMFVTYLAIRYKGRPKCRTPVACCTDYRDDVPESGFFVENHLFGGCFIRGRDTSGRANRFMPGVPVIQVGKGEDRGIPLAKVMNLVNKPLDQPYTTSDFELNLYPPHDNLSNSALPSVRFKRWWVEYHDLFGFEFALDLGNRVYQDFDEVEVSDTPSTADNLTRRNSPSFPSTFTCPIWSKLDIEQGNYPVYEMVCLEDDENLARVDHGHDEARKTAPATTKGLRIETPVNSTSMGWNNSWTKVNAEEEPYDPNRNASPE